MKNVENLIGEDFQDLILGLNRFLRGLRGINDSVFHYAASNRGNEVQSLSIFIEQIDLNLCILYSSVFTARLSPLSCSLGAEVAEPDSASRQRMPR